MSRGPRITDEVRRAVEEAAHFRIVAPRDKEITQRFKISRASLHRIIQAARLKLLRQLSQSEVTERDDNR